ncbi:MAG: hypothetical protein WAV72_18885 [Bradyrhizobium sp.]
MPKFTGVLNTPIKASRASMLNTAESINREYFRVLSERLHKLEALATHYEVSGKLGSPATLLLLVTRLASDTVPGFMLEGDTRVKKSGARKKHDDHALFLLLARVETLRLGGLDDTSACQVIATEDDPKLGSARRRSARIARGKTLQNLLPKARARPFASGVAAIAQKRGKLTAAEYDALRFGIVDAKTFVALEKLIARVSATTPEI